MIPPSNLNPPRLQDARRSIVVDMSPQAIDQRLREVSQLWAFGQKLRNFQRVSVVESPVTNAPTLPEPTAK